MRSAARFLAACTASEYLGSPRIGEGRGLVVAWALRLELLPGIRQNRMQLLFLSVGQIERVKRIGHAAVGSHAAVAVVSLVMMVPTVMVAVTMPVVIAPLPIPPVAIVSVTTPTVRAAVAVRHGQGCDCTQCRRHHDAPQSG